jgi:16S rRNA (cytidine1402-2'-O)-methyltransferase
MGCHERSDPGTIGIVSEAGCPGIADPGQELVAIAHQQKAIVKPLVGPSSITLALMASGFNGQQFTFHGYLPIEDIDRSKKIKYLEELSSKTGATQIFIETPYRNQKLLHAIMNNCRPATRLCVALNITSSDEAIMSMTIAEWKKYPVDLHKIPAIFLLNSL